MHQTSEMTLDGAIREINRAMGKQAVQRNNTVFHLAKRGNTATNSHFLAVRENMEAGKIAQGDSVFFAVSGSGQVVGSALYIFDDLPNRQINGKKPRSASSANGQSNRGLQFFPCQRRIGIESVGLAPEALGNSIAMLRAAGEACFDGSTRRREEIDLIMHTGTYRSEFLCEPALAAIAAGELGINHDDEKPTGTRTFAFDLTNGAAGTLTGCHLASQLVGGGKYKRALILASEVENNATVWADHTLGLKETASALILEEGSSGFRAFGFRTFPEHSDCVESYTVSHNQRSAWDIARMRILKPNMKQTCVPLSRCSWPNLVWKRPMCAGSCCPSVPPPL